jgi:transcription-repair coupling factor (superfamily II helicase)
MTGNRFFEDCSTFITVEFGKKGVFDSQMTFDFRTEPQPVFNKNFELLSEKIVTNSEEGKKTFIVSESQSQIDRLKDIFEEINPEAHFTPMLLNLHSGFTDHHLTYRSLPITRYLTATINSK